MSKKNLNIQKKKKSDNKEQDYLVEKKLDWKKLNLKEKLFEAWIVFRQNEGRGSGFFSHFWDYLQKGAMLSIMSVAIGYTIPPNWYIPLGIGYVSAMFLWGVFDKKYLKLWQYEQERSQTRVNPYFVRLEQKVDNLNNNLKKIETELETSGTR